MLIGGVGYRYTRDLAFGPAVVDRLRGEIWPPHVEVEDLSYTPVAVVQRWLETPCARLLLVGALPRGNRTPGVLVRYAPTAVSPPPDEVQRRIGEALGGVISLENLVVVARQFGVLPRDTEVLELEPVDTGWGEGLSPPAAAAVEIAVAIVRDLVAPVHDAGLLQALHERDETLQILYWLEGEQLVDTVAAADLLPFLPLPPQIVAAHLQVLRRQGYVDRVQGAGDRYRLTAAGRREGGRRFAEEFAPLLRQGHGECNDPACECHRTGDPTLCPTRQRPG